nr:RNA-directed DNA polymerase, eukaryota, reverse transcriptase zinc-binding domain protein [Tanacetum cinerariifolium]
MEAEDGEIKTRSGDTGNGCNDGCCGDVEGDVVGNNDEIDIKMFYVPTGQNDNGDEVAIFEEELVIKGMNVPFEAWSPRGISTLASRLGKPIMMDSMTATMCHKGTGRFGYVRILVEVEASKGLPDRIEIAYRDTMNKTIMTKHVKVEYDWRPVICCSCGVFGHKDSNCRKTNKGNVEEKNDKANGENASNEKE